MDDIDRQIAEKVMGFEVLMLAPNGDLVTKHSNNWQPSTRIDHAFEVVEKMGGDFFLTKHFRDPKWEAEFCTKEKDGIAEADTPAMAICKAALETSC